MATEKRKWYRNSETEGLVQVFVETSADQVKITDAEGKFTSNDVEGALKELANRDTGKIDDVQVKDSGDYASVVQNKIAKINISNKVDKVEGKGLSTNDYTTAEKNKLNSIEAEAQKNNIIQLNGSTITPTDNIVNIQIPNAPTYTIEKQSQAEAGYAHTYYLKKNGVKEGDSINIPKDLVVKSGSVVTVDNKKYIRLVLINDSTIDVAVDSLVDIYTSGTGVTVDSTNRTISLNRSQVDTYYDASGTAETKVNALAQGQVATNKTNIESLQTTVGDASKGLVKKVNDLALNKQDNLSEAQLQAIADVANKVDKIPGKGLSTNDYDNAAVAEVAKISNKADKANIVEGNYSCTHVNNQGIVTGGGQIIEFGVSGQSQPSTSLCYGGMFFELQ